MKIKTKKSDVNFSKIKSELDKRLLNAGRAMARVLAGKTEEAVTNRIPNRGGWLAIYRDAITYRETSDGKKLVVIGFSERDELFEFPAENSLLFFAGSGFGQYTAVYNPWPIDVIPPVYGGYNDTAVVQRHSPNKVANYRRARLKNISTIVDALTEAGARIDESGDTLVHIGRIYADIAYMARRLELGLDEYPRVPHWGPASSELASQAMRWVMEPAAQTAIEDALNGKELENISEISPSTIKHLDRLKELT